MKIIESCRCADQPSTSLEHLPTWMHQGPGDPQDLNQMAGINGMLATERAGR